MANDHRRFARLDTFVADLPNSEDRAFWSQLTAGGDVRIGYPDWSDILWVLVQTPAQEASVLAWLALKNLEADDTTKRPHVQVVRLGMAHKMLGVETMQEMEDTFLEVGSCFPKPEGVTDGRTTPTPEDGPSPTPDDARGGAARED